MLTSIALALSGGAQPQLPGFLNSLSGPLNHYGLWAVLALVLIEDFGIPVPGETVLIAASVFAGSGRLNVFTVALVGFAAAVLGDNIGYAIGRFGGRRLLDRWGKYVFLTPERLDRAEAFFNRHGARIIVIARFIEGLRQANGIIAGITQMHWLRFLACNALGAALWVGTWVSIGYFAGQHLTTIYNAITKYTLYAAIAAVVVIAVWIGWRVRGRRRRKAEAAGGAAAGGAAAGGAAADVNVTDGGGPDDGSSHDGSSDDRGAGGGAGRSNAGRTSVGGAGAGPDGGGTSVGGAGVGGAGVGGAGAGGAGAGGAGAGGAGAGGAGAEGGGTGGGGIRDAAHGEQAED